jgi:hypothetical protein
VDQDFLRRLKTALEELGPELDTQNDTAKTAAAGVGEEAERAQRKFLTSSDQLEIRRTLRKLNDAELYAMFSAQAQKRETGIPVDAWAAAGGNGNAIAGAMASNPTVTRALDTSGATALIRQDLEPILYELFLRSFPAWERMPKEPANGLVHAYNRQTTYGDAQFMPELGTVTDDTAAYTRATTPISVLATRRGVSIKAQAGTMAGGAGFNPEQLELRSGLLAIAHKMQKTIFQGNASVSTAASNGLDEDGAYDVNAFDGLRRILKGGSGENTPVQVDPTLSTPEDVRKVVNDAIISAIQLNGNPRIAYLDPIAKGQIDVQQDKNVRYTDNYTNVAVGVQTNAINTANGPMPLFVIPGDSIGTYTVSGPKTVSDLYLLDESAISIPYLGSDGPTVLDIPMGLSGQLTRMFIIFGMWGLAVKAVRFHNKVRIVRP